MKSLILNKQALMQSIKRLAYEIVEDQFDEQELCFVGITQGGYFLADLLSKEVSQIKQFTLSVHSLKMNKEKPLDATISLSETIGFFENKAIILVDDVANSGKTLFYAFKPFLDINCKSLKVAVLVDRKHKRFPVQCDYVGKSLNTTIQEHIEVVFNGDEVDAAYLV